MGFHPGVSVFDTGITGAGPIKPGLWLTEHIQGSVFKDSDQLDHWSYGVTKSYNSLKNTDFV